MALTRLVGAVWLAMLFSIQTALATQCACATLAVHVRSDAGVSHAVITTLAKGHCLTYKEHRKSVAGASWVNVDYHGRNGWIHSGYVHISTCHGSGHGSSHHVQLPGCPHIITRANWGARAATHSPGLLPHIPRYMFIHHGATDSCYTKTECSAKVRAYQNYHMDTHNWSDIGYSFVVGEDGNVYEARGWDEVGAHTYNYNSVGLAICVIGDFTLQAPNHAALNAVKNLIACGLANGKLTSNYMLRGHRDMGSTSCPGNKLYDLIKHWPHY